MKTVFVLLSCMSLLAAEEPDALNLITNMPPSLELSVPAEQLAGQEIESFFEAEDTPAEMAQTAPQPELPPPAAQNVAATEIADLEQEALAEKPEGVVIDFRQVFSGSPAIYSVLIALSMGSLALWFYTLMNLRASQLVPQDNVKELRELLMNKRFEDAAIFCQGKDHVLFRMLGTGLAARSQGQQVIIDQMNAEGRRGTAFLWQKVALLNDIAIIAPMLGLLGTVMGMFYAFYDLNRSMESITALFDGLGISVGTTVCGLLVAIVAMMFQSIAKYRLTKQLTAVEVEAQSLANLIERE